MNNKKFKYENEYIMSTIIKFFNIGKDEFFPIFALQNLGTPHCKYKNEYKFILIGRIPNKIKKKLARSVLQTL